MLARIHQFCECIGYGYSLSPANAKWTLGKLQQFLKNGPESRNNDSRIKSYHLFTCIQLYNVTTVLITHTHIYLIANQKCLHWKNPWPRHSNAELWNPRSEIYHCHLPYKLHLVLHQSTSHLTIFSHSQHPHFYIMNISHFSNLIYHLQHAWSPRHLRNQPRQL